MAPDAAKWVPDRFWEAPENFLLASEAILGDFGRPKGGHFWPKTSVNFEEFFGVDLGSILGGILAPKPTNLFL